jgi:hypothetical protein
VPEGSPATPPPAAETASSPAEDEGQTPQSVEDVETIWKTRVSNKDKAHAAEVAVLRQQVADKDRQLQAKAQTDSANQSDADQWKSRYEAEVKAREDQQSQNLADVRKAKYPSAADVLDAMSLVQMDEGKLAALNSRLTEDETPTGGHVDPSAPRRTSSPPRPLEAQSVAELEAELARQGPAWTESINSGE